MTALGFEDSFGKLIADGTRNIIDIGSHYPASPERWRLLVDGARRFPEYGSVAEYNHAGDVHELMPSAGSTVVFETAELLTYVVQYELEASWALSLNQELQIGDRLRFGVFNDTDGWFLEHNASHGRLECDLVIRRGGSEAVRTLRSLAQPFVEFARYASRYSWYNVGPAIWSQFYTHNGGRMHRIGPVSVDSGGRGPLQGNMPIRYEITAGGSTTGLKLNAGSVAGVTLGSTNAINRVKGADFVDTIGTTGTWVPLRAFRHAPGKELIGVRLTELGILQYSVSSTVRLMAMVMPRELVSFNTDDWSVPPEWLAANNALETRTDISSVPANDGTTSATVSDPGGYQINRSILASGNASTNTGTLPGGGREQKRNITPGDYVIILGKSDSTGDVTYDFVTEQDW